MRSPKSQKWPQTYLFKEESYLAKLQNFCSRKFSVVEGKPMIP